MAKLVPEVNAKLDHEPFHWELEVESTLHPPPSEAQTQIFTVRIFIVPTELLEDQHAWIEMDKFNHTLKKASDTITRNDTESSVARKTPSIANESLDKQEKQSATCLCGWPQNLMLPVGTKEGMNFTAFAMLTDEKLGKASHTVASLIPRLF